MDDRVPDDRRGAMVMEPLDKFIQDERIKRALLQMLDAWIRLKEEGWDDWIFMPKDGTRVHLIEAGSSGIHVGYYSGEWPNGHVWVEDSGDLYPSHPILYRAI